MGQSHAAGWVISIFYQQCSVLGLGGWSLNYVIGRQTLLPVFLPVHRSIRFLPLHFWPSPYPIHPISCLLFPFPSLPTISFPISPSFPFPSLPRGSRPFLTPFSIPITSFFSATRQSEGALKFVASLSGARVRRTFPVAFWAKNPAYLILMSYYGNMLLAVVSSELLLAHQNHCVWEWGRDQVLKNTEDSTWCDSTDLMQTWLERAIIALYYLFIRWFKHNRHATVKQ